MKTHQKGYKWRGLCPAIFLFNFNINKLGYVKNSCIFVEQLSNTLKTHTMKITYKNITVDYSYQEEDFNGAGYFDFSTEVLNKFIQENEGAEYTRNLVSEIDEAKEEGYLTETFQISDTDLGVYIFYWMLFECPKENFTFEYYGESPFWLFHDLSHAENDVIGSVFYVDPNIEEERIFDGLKLLKKYGMIEEFTVKMFESIVNDFRQRWNHEIDTKRILKKMGWKKRDFSIC